MTNDDLAAIAAFIERRLAEWEAAAKTAQLVRAEGWYEIAQQAVACTDTIEIGFAYQHIVLHDPASALRQVAAIRRILGWANSPALPDIEKLYVLDAVARFWENHPDHPGELEL